MGTTEPEGTLLAAQLGDAVGGPGPDPETPLADALRHLGEARRLGESWAMETGTRREDGVSLLAVLGDAAPPVAAALDRSTIDSEVPASDDTSRAPASAHGKPRERAGAVAGECSDDSDAEAAEPHMNLLETAWGVIANAGWDGMAKTPGWQEAAVRWRDDYHCWLDLHLRPGGYQTWEELAVSVTRERDALFAEVAELRRTIRAINDAKELDRTEEGDGYDRDFAGPVL